MEHLQDTSNSILCFKSNGVPIDFPVDVPLTDSPVQTLKQSAFFIYLGTSGK